MRAAALALALVLAGCEDGGSTGGQTYPRAYTPIGAETLLERTCECMGMCAPMPEFEAVADGALDPLDGITWLGDGMIWIEEWASETDVLIRHELVHWILAWNGVPDDENVAHATPGVWVCI